MNMDSGWRTPANKAANVDHDLGKNRRSGKRLVLWGRAQTFVGYVLILMGAGLGAAAYSASDGDVRSQTFLVTMVVAISCPFVGHYLFHKGRSIRLQGEQLRAEIIDSFEQLAQQKYLLYLRPFDLDAQTAELPTEPPSRLWASDANLSWKTHEEQMMRWFKGYGQIIAVGRPSEPLPLAGAKRGYLNDDDWKDVVSRLISGAHAVVLAVGPKPGTVWEFTEVLRTTEPERVVLLVCHQEAPYSEFRDMARDEYEWRSSVEAGQWPPLPELPDYPPLQYPQRRSWDFGLKGVITFDATWGATFTRFDPTRPVIPISLIINGIQRRGMKPIQKRLAQLPRRRRKDTQV